MKNIMEKRNKPRHKINNNKKKKKKKRRTLMKLIAGRGFAEFSSSY